MELPHSSKVVFLQYLIYCVVKQERRPQFLDTSRSGGKACPGARVNQESPFLQAHASTRKKGDTTKPLLWELPLIF